MKSSKKAYGKTGLGHKLCAAYVFIVGLGATGRNHSAAEWQWVYKDRIHNQSRIQHQASLKINTRLLVPPSSHEYVVHTHIKASCYRGLFLRYWKLLRVLRMLIFVAWIKYCGDTTNTKNLKKKKKGRKRKKSVCECAFNRDYNEIRIEEGKL